MALQMNTTFKGIPVIGAYVRVTSTVNDREGNISVIRYGVWRNAAAAEIVEPDRAELTVAEANLDAFNALDPESMTVEQRESGLRYHTLQVERLRRAYEDQRKPVEPSLETASIDLPYDPDLNVPKAYLEMKGTAKLADAIDA